MYQIVRNNIKNLTFENACIEVHRITMKMFVYLFKCLFTCWWATISTNILWRVRYNAACAALVVKYRFWRLSWSGNPAHSLLSYSHHPLSSSHLVRNELIHTNILRYVNRSKKDLLRKTHMDSMIILYYSTSYLYRFTTHDHLHNVQYYSTYMRSTWWANQSSVHLLYDHLARGSMT